ncbi:Uncharacterized protein Fot_36405 [Forsythia ovata]|uniref:Uncharacterized protein n=1 Tax=Forsythia ovata TaxID=205694 RepID=A0ABD1SPB7_9LAMI
MGQAAAGQVQAYLLGRGPPSKHPSSVSTTAENLLPPTPTTRWMMVNSAEASHPEKLKFARADFDLSLMLLQLELQLKHVQLASDNPGIKSSPSNVKSNKGRCCLKVGN